MTGAADPRPDVRERLVAMRGELVARLVAEGPSGGTLALLADCEIALAALDKAQGSPLMHESGDPVTTTGNHPSPNSARILLAKSDVRAALLDDGASELRLVIFDRAGALAAISLDPVRAVGLAGELIVAAHARLSR